MAAVELSALAEDLSKVLLPYLPYLIKGGKILGTEAIKGAGKKIGESSWKFVEQVWGKLKDKIKKKPETIKALEKVAEKPDDPKSEAVLSWHLEELLQDFEESLLAEIQHMLESDEGKQIILSIGERSVAVGKAKDVVISTGDNAEIDKK